MKVHQTVTPFPQPIFRKMLLYVGESIRGISFHVMSFHGNESYRSTIDDTSSLTRLRLIHCPTPVYIQTGLIV